MVKRVPCPRCGEPKLPRSKMCRPCLDMLRGPDHPAWKGGRISDSYGYVLVYVPDDPRANCGRYMKEHIIVMEAVLGRQLTSSENVHHKNGVKTDNRPDNLELWSTSQPPGQRVEDKVTWAKEILALYERGSDGELRGEDTRGSLFFYVDCTGFQYSKYSGAVICPGCGRSLDSHSKRVFPE